MEQSLKVLRQWRVNALYSKKQHFNAAARNTTYYNRFQLLIIGLSAINGGLLFFLLKQCVECLVYVSPALSLAVAVLSGIQKYKDFNRKAEMHNAVGEQYLSLIRKINISIAHYQDTNDACKLTSDIDVLSEDYDKTAQVAKTIPTNAKDYAMAKKGIADGEETYTDDEMSIGE